jgi:Cell wall-associated hydrolases (invasion-associated proteins)
MAYSGGTAYQGGMATVAGGGPAGTAADDFVRLALAQSGDRYVFGTEVDLNNPDPSVFDCSELTQWAAHQVGVDLPEASYLQYQELQQHGGAVSVEQAIRTKGALLFYFSEPPVGTSRPSQAHVAISLGDGRTIEARGTQYGVNTFDANTSRFNYAAVIPQLSGPGQGAGLAMPTLTAAQDFGPALDSDADGLVDGRELAMGSDPNKIDSDADGLSDGYEVARLGTSATKADTDGDGLGDAFELAGGSDPIKADSDHDGRLDGEPDTAPDSDHDEISDALERLLRTDPLSVDSDGDGFTDGLEYQGYFDPADPFSNPTTGTGAVPGGAAAGLGTGLPGQGMAPTGLPGGLTGSGLSGSGLSGSGLSGGGLSGGGLTGRPGDPTAALDDLGAS